MWRKHHTWALTSGFVAAAAGCAGGDAPTRQELMTPFELDTTRTTTWSECIAYYAKLDSAFEEVTLLEVGTTDVGKPLHLVTVSDRSIESPVDAGDKAVLLVMNNIHPGEPEGADASMMLARELVLDATLRPLLEHVVVLIMPMYNVDGALNRGMTRANQNGPREHGFRGNARNLDLNRDFMKADALNTRSFMRLFQAWRPHVFIDNHTTDGADYQPVMTLISTQKDKLHPLLSAHMTQRLDPFLYERMNAPGGLGMIPYVDVWGGAIPDSGMVAFLETPRYSTGFTTLFNTIGYVAEAHMLKPFPQRVRATYDLLLAIVQRMSTDHVQLGSLRIRADEAVAQQDTFPLNWTMDSTYRWIDYPGYEASFRISAITGGQVAQYDRSQPFVKRIKYYDTYKPATTVAKPTAYVIPQAWREAVELLHVNGVPTKRLEHDTVMQAEAYYIEQFETARQPYEGHYLHSGTSVSRDTHSFQFYAGDYIIPLGHRTDRFVVEALEPEAIDSWFNWNFFDEVLQQKEWFSPWLFDSAAVKMITDNPELQKEFDQWILDNPGASGNDWAMLSFFHQRSKFYEKTVKRYPVFRLL